MSKPREVLLYPGSPKTGTTALQAALRCNVAQLKAAGWNYLHDPVEGDPNSKGSGNSLRFSAALSGLSDGDPLAEFEIIAPAGERSIIAGEVFSLTPLDDWSPIIELLEAEGGTIRSVYCVRDLYPFLWSAHNQVVSVFRQTGEFSAGWIAAGGTKLRPRARLLDTYALPLPDAPCVTSQTLLHYETIKENLLEEMILAGGLPLESFDLSQMSSVKRPINRSLTQPEVALMLAINSEVDEFRSQWSGLALTQRPSPRPVRPVWVPDAYQWLADNAQPTLDEFNAQLPAGTEWKVQILDRSKYELEEVDPHPEESPEFADAIYHLLSFDPTEDYREFLISLLPGGVYDPSPPPGRLRRAAGKVKRTLTRA